MTVLTAPQVIPWLVDWPVYKSNLSNRYIKSGRTEEEHILFNELLGGECPRPIPDALVLTDKSL